MLYLRFSFENLSSVLVPPRVGLAVLQRNIRKYLVLRNWGWWRLYTKVKPLLNVARAEDEMKAMDEELQKAKDKAAKEEKERKILEEKNTELLKEKNDFFMQLQQVKLRQNINLKQSGDHPIKIRVERKFLSFICSP